MKYKLEQEKLSKKWIITQYNQALSYPIYRLFDSKEDAQNFVNAEIEQSKIRMQDIVSINDYFKVQA